MEKVKGIEEEVIRHIPVMLEEVVKLFEPCKGGVFVDGTLGLGGHAKAILEHLDPTLYIGLDRDRGTLKLAADNLADFGQKLRLFHALYSQVGEVLEEMGLDGVDAFLLDLGVSSVQLEGRDRGFSFLRNEVLDMRMDKEEEVTAAHIVNTYSAGELERIFREYGEERWAKKLPGTW